MRVCFVCEGLAELRECVCGCMLPSLKSPPFIHVFCLYTTKPVWKKLFQGTLRSEISREFGRVSRVMSCRYGEIIYVEKIFI